MRNVRNGVVPGVFHFDGSYCLRLFPMGRLYADVVESQGAVLRRLFVAHLFQTLHPRAVERLVGAWLRGARCLWVCDTHLPRQPGHPGAYRGSQRLESL